MKRQKVKYLLTKKRKKRRHSDEGEMLKAEEVKQNQFELMQIKRRLRMDNAFFGIRT